MRKYKGMIQSVLIILLTLVGMLLLSNWQYLHDNKYTTGPPYGQTGVIDISKADKDRPVFLIDGWEFYLDVWYTPKDFSAGNTIDPLYIFIGQYSNFSYVKQGHSPFGRATYRLRLKSDGEARAMALEIPEIFTACQIWIDGSLVSDPGQSTMADFILDGQSELIINVENHTHYYSGLYYPPVLGSASAINRMLAVRQLFYGALCISSLTLALFSGILWFSRKRDQLFFQFGILCLSFAVVCLHPLIRLTGINGTIWYAIEDGARLVVLLQAARIGSIVCGFHSKANRFIMRYILPAIVLLCVSCILFMIPSYGQIIRFYGVCIDTCTLAAWMWLCICASKGLCNQVSGSNMVLVSGCILGMGFLLNLLENNHFEPIYTGWQSEYTSYLMVLAFGWLMICRNRDILEENRILVSHMEEMVQDRTRELHSVLEERKNFFSDMAHNLKAPIAAVHGFISLIREGNLYLDDELKEYIHMIEYENNEIRQRVQALNTINAFDRVTTPPIPVELNQLLEKVYEDNYPDTGVMGLHFMVNTLPNQFMICGQMEKLLTLFENLIYNAISFTPEGGSISISCSCEEDFVIVKVTDTGSGIDPEHLPYIFDRFYVGRKDKSLGSGLGLYIAKITVEEMGGKITAASVLGEGTVFTIWFPVLCGKSDPNV